MVGVVKFESFIFKNQLFVVFFTISIPNLRGGLGSFFTAKFEKKFLKILELILASKECFPSIFRQIFEGLSCLKGRPNDLRLFHNSFGLPIFSFSFLTTQFLFFFFLKLAWSV